MVTRRTVLAGVTSTIPLSVAGCLSDLGTGSNDTDDSNETEPTDDEPTEGSENESADEQTEESENESDDEYEQVDGAYELTIAEIEEGDWIGERVRVEGTITEAVGGDTVERFVLEDDTGTLRMVYPDEARSDYGEGTDVRVEGIVTDGEDVPSTPPVIEEAVVYVQ